MSCGTAALPAAAANMQHDSGESSAERGANQPGRRRRRRQTGQPGERCEAEHRFGSCARLLGLAALGVAATLLLVCASAAGGAYFAYRHHALVSALVAPPGAQQQARSLGAAAEDCVDCVAPHLQPPAGRRLAGDGGDGADVVVVSDKPYYDFVLAIFSGDGVDAVAKRDKMRKIYEAYDKGIRIFDEQGQLFTYTVKVLFLVSHIDASEEGDLVGDILYVQCPAGYRNIVQKTKAMLSIVTHFEFRYLTKSDDDTFVCLNRVAKRMFMLPGPVKDKVYAGIPTACGLESNPHIGKVIKDPSHKWHDAKFVSHTLGGLDCYPPYHQGAFYLLSAPLVQYLHQGRSKLLTFTNEDVTMGTWLMGVDREMIAFNSISEARLWECTCSKFTKWLKYDTNAFFHNCKALEQLQSCSELLPFC